MKSKQLEQGIPSSLRSSSSVLFPPHAFPSSDGRRDRHHHQVAPTHSWGEENELVAMNSSHPFSDPDLTLFLPLFPDSNDHSSSFSRSNRSVRVMLVWKEGGGDKVYSRNSEMWSYPPIKKRTSLSCPHFAL